MTDQEFIKEFREQLPHFGYESLATPLAEALDRLEAIIGQGTKTKMKMLHCQCPKCGWIELPEGKPTPGQIGAIDGDKLVEWLKFHIKDYDRLADSHEKMEDIRRKNECVEQSLTHAHFLRVVESGRFSVGQGQEERDYTPERNEK